MCGVFGVSLPPGSGTEAAAVASTGLFSLQHRGQESAGVAVSDGAEIAGRLVLSDFTCEDVKKK